MEQMVARRRAHEAATGQPPQVTPISPVPPPDTLPPQARSHNGALIWPGAFDVSTVTSEADSEAAAESLNGESTTSDAEAGQTVQALQEAPRP